MGARKTQGRMSLDRREDERPDMHRGLLLFTMMDKGTSKHYRSIAGRPLAPVQKAVGRARSAVQAWTKSREWRRRIRAHGRDAQRYAVDLYRRLYLRQWGEHDMAFVGEYISIPLDEPAISEDSKEQTIRLMRALAPDVPAEDIQKRAEAARRKARHIKIQNNQALQTAVDRAVTVIDQGLQAAVDEEFAKKNPHIQKLVPRPGDLLPLYKLKKDLQEDQERLENPEIVQAGTGAAVESIRVRIAKETGGSVLEAVRADCREILAITDQQLQPARSFQDLEQQRQEETRDARTDDRTEGARHRG